MSSAVGEQIPEICSPVPAPREGTGLLQGDGDERLEGLETMKGMKTMEEVEERQEVYLVAPRPSILPSVGAFIAFTASSSSSPSTSVASLTMRRGQRWSVSSDLARTTSHRLG